jgi:hypothetical protein
MAASILAFASFVNAAMPANYTGTVFSAAPLNGIPQQIPGLVETAYFDEGAVGVTYNYFAGSQGGDYNQGDCLVRTGHGGTDVSIQYYGAEKDFVSGNVLVNDSMCFPVNAHAHLGWIEPAPNANSRGEWENYTVHVNAAGNYKMIFHESDVNYPNLILVTFSGMKTDSVSNMPLSIRPPGDHEAYHDWKWDTTATKLALDTGLYVVTLEFITGAWNFHAMKFILDGASAVTEKSQGLRQEGLGLVAIANGNNLTLSYAAGQAGPARISVVDCAGRAVLSALDYCATAGSRTKMIPLQDVRRGVYFVKVEQNGLKETKSIFLAR